MKSCTCTRLHTKFNMQSAISFQWHNNNSKEKKTIYMQILRIFHTIFITFKLFILFLLNFQSCAVNILNIKINLYQREEEKNNNWRLYEFNCKGCKSRYNIEYIIIISYIYFILLHQMLFYFKNWQMQALKISLFT